MLIINLNDKNIDEGNFDSTNPRLLNAALLD